MKLNGAYQMPMVWQNKFKLIKEENMNNYREVWDSQNYNYARPIRWDVRPVNKWKTWALYMVSFVMVLASIVVWAS